MRVTGSAISRECALAAVLGHDERAAVGVVAAVLGAVGTRLEGQLTGVRAGGHGDRAGIGCEAQVGESRHRELR